MEDDLLYSLTASFYNGLTIRISEHVIVNETSKSYMVNATDRWGKREKVALPKDEEGKVQIDHHHGHIHKATLYLTEVSREDVDTHGVKLLTDELRKWLKGRADYYSRKVKELDKPTFD